MIERDAVASLRGRAAPRNGISWGGLLTAQNTQQATTDSTINSPVRGLRLGGDADHLAVLLHHLKLPLPNRPKRIANVVETLAPQKAPKRRSPDPSKSIKFYLH